MPYFHQSICISPQNSFPETDLSQIRESKNNLLKVVEPDYPGIPAGVKRRMGKSVRMAVGAAFPLLEKYPQPDGIDHRDREWGYGGLYQISESDHRIQ